MEEKSKSFRAVIAHPAPEQRQRIRAALERDGTFTVHCATHDGLDCLQKVLAIQPELVVLDLVLEKIDGLEVLRRLKSFSLPRTRIIVLMTHSNYLSNQALLAGADYCILTPYCDDILAQRAWELVSPPQAVFSDQTIDAQATAILRELGASEHLKGFDYALRCVRILVRDPELPRRRKIIAELYDVVARDAGVRTVRVERCIRTLTAGIFDKGDPKALAARFTPADIQRSHMTNTAFLTTISRGTVAALEASRAPQRREEAI